MRKLALALVFLVALPLVAGHRLMRASWYGNYPGSRLTASGERFDQWGHTCAHRELPFGTWLRLVNVRNGRVSYARVTDRGPASWTGRDLDVSTWVAWELGFKEQGVTLVRAEVVDVD